MTRHLAAWTGLAVLCAVPAVGQFVDDGWTYSMRIEFPGYDGGETLHDFPALVVFQPGSNGFSYSQFASETGADLRFADAWSLRELNYEIDEWHTNGNSLVWVQVPQLTGDAAIKAYWGNAEATVPACATNGSAWSNACLSVWHLNEDGFPYTNSRTPAHLATNGFAPERVAGKVGLGQHFDQDDTTNYVEIGVHDLGDRFTVSAWVNLDTNAADIETILGAKGPYTQEGWAFYVNRWDVTPSTDQRLLFEGYGPIYWYIETETNVCTYGEWHHVAAVINRFSGTGTLYADGEEVLLGQNQVGSFFDNNRTVYIGKFLPELFRLDAIVDEIRIETAERSPAWMRAVWLNVVSNEAFNAYGPVARRGTVFVFE